VIVNTTVQPKNVMFPTDAKLIHRARERLVRLAKQTGLNLRQSCVRVGKQALIRHQRYAHAKQFKRAGKALRRLKTYLGRTIRDIRRRIDGDKELDAIFKWPLYQGETVMQQRQRQRGRKIYSLHAHEVECIEGVTTGRRSRRKGPVDLFEEGTPGVQAKGWQRMRLTSSG